MVPRLLLAVVAALAPAACQADSVPQQALGAPKSVEATPALAPSIPPRQLPKTLVALGASDVTGIGADNPATDGWAPVLASLLPGDKSLLRLGFPGWTAKQIRANVLNRAVLAQPDVVVLWTGMNDINAGVSLESFETDMEAMLAALEKTGAKLYCLNLPQLDKLPAHKDGQMPSRPEVPLWQKAIQDAAGRHGAQVIDLASYSDEIEAHPDYISADGFHPSTRGYRRLAEIIEALVEPAWDL